MPLDMTFKLDYSYHPKFNLQLIKLSKFVFLIHKNMVLLLMMFFFNFICGKTLKKLIFKNKEILLIAIE